MARGFPRILFLRVVLSAFCGTSPSILPSDDRESRSSSGNRSRLRSAAANYADEQRIHTNQLDPGMCLNFEGDFLGPIAAATRTPEPNGIIYKVILIDHLNAPPK